MYEAMPTPSSHNFFGRLSHVYSRLQDFL